MTSILCDRELQTREEFAYKLEHLKFQARKIKFAYNHELNKHIDEAYHIILEKVYQENIYHIKLLAQY